MFNKVILSIRTNSFSQIRPMTKSIILPNRSFSRKRNGTFTTSTNVDSWVDGLK